MNSLFTIEVISAFFTGVLGPVAYFAAKWYLDNRSRNKRDDIKYNLRTTTAIDSELLKLRHESGSDRVWVIQFHNGATSYPTGKSIQKFSIFYENTNSKVKTLSTTFNSLPVSLFTKTLYKLSQGKLLHFTESKNVLLSDFQSALQSHGVVSSFICPMFDLHQKFIGCLGIDYVTSEQDFDNDLVDMIENHASHLAGFLANFNTSQYPS